MGDITVLIPQEIRSVVDAIAGQFSPEKIYLFSNKRGQHGKAASFKLCVVLDHGDRGDMEREIYLRIDSEVPFDVVAYTTAEWAELLSHKGSFAEKVANTGVLVYG